MKNTLIALGIYFFSMILDFFIGLTISHEAFKPKCGIPMNLLITAFAVIAIFGLSALTYLKWHTDLFNGKLSKTGRIKP